MTTPNPLFSKFDQALGKSTPTSSVPQAPKWGDELRNMQTTSTPIPTKNLGDFTADAEIEGGKKIASAVSTGAQKIQEGTAKGGIKGTGEALLGIGEAGLGTASGFLQTIFSPITGAVNDAASHLSNNPVVQKIAQSGFGDAIAKGEDGFNTWAQAHPELATNLSDALNVGLASLTGGEDIKMPDLTTVKNDLGGLKDKVTGLATGAKDKVLDTTSNIKNDVTGTQKNDLQTLKDKITPAPTKNQAQLATEQGRLYKGSDPTLLRQGSADQIATSPQQHQSTLTIDRLIPEHAQMDEPTLYDAMNEKVTQTAQALKPKLEAVPVEPGTVEKINTDWENLKKTQLQEAKATDEPNVQKWQKNFEKFLKKSGSENINDLWESVKEYDSSIKANVKNATEISPEDLQTQKEIWQQNRAILRSAMDSVTDTLDPAIKQSFSDMRDMYEAQEGILSKSKIEKTGKPSKLSQAYNSKTGKVVRAGLTIEGAKHALGL